MTTHVPANAKEMTISMVILNADGSVKEDRGVVCYWHKNPIKRLFGSIAVRLRGIK